MDLLKNNIVETAAGDTVDGPIYQRQTSACCEEKYLRKAVLYATSEDDPETLEALKEWALDHGKVETPERLNCYCPMIVACIEVKLIISILNIKRRHVVYLFFNFRDIPDAFQFYMP